MKGRPMSATKFRSIEVPRSQNGWMAQQYSAGKDRFMSARKSAQLNPQQAMVSDRAYHGMNKYDANLQKKLDLNAVQTQANTARDPIVFKPEKAREQPQVNSYGRRLEYPHSRPTNVRPQSSDPVKKRSYSMDQQSKHLTDRTVKSKKLQQQKSRFEQKFAKAFEYLVNNNKNYLKEHSRICNQRARPKQQILNINLAPTSNTYRDHYPAKQAKYDFPIEPQNQKHAFSLPEGKVTGNSLSHQAHNGRQGPRADLQSWPEGFKLQGPLDSTTTYANHFPHNGDFQKMVPIATFNEHVRGMPHKTNSTHREHYKGSPGKKADIAAWNNLHPYGNQFNPDRGSHYGTTHDRKEQQPIQQWPMHDPRLITTKGKFSTEYKGNMDDMMRHQLNQENYCDCDRCNRRKSARSKIRH